MNRIKLVYLTLGLVLLTSIGATAGEVVNTSRGLTAAGGALAIHWYDTVSYFEQGVPQRGVAVFSTKHDGAVYRFASEANMRTFVKNPTRYAPQYGGFCAYGTSVGKKFDGDPLVYRIVNDKLYFNLNPEIKATWVKDLATNITKADSQWPKIRSKDASAL